MKNKKEITISTLYWYRKPGEFALTQGKAVESLGYDHHFFHFDEQIPKDTQIILAQGPYKTLVLLVDQLLQYPINKRPYFIYWFQQSLNLNFPVWMNEMFSRSFSELHQKYNNLRPIGRLANVVAPKLFSSKGVRYRYLGDILWLSERKLLDLLVLSSTVYAEYFEKNYNIPSIVAPRGSAPDHGTILNVERDIAAVWMGKLRTRRRRRAVYWIKQQLAKRGLDMHIYDGIENDFIYGQQRTEILNRAWFVLNIFFSDPTNELSIRFFISGANGAVIITEPGLNKYPFISGEHIVVSNIKEMPNIIEYYIHHKEEWQRISKNMKNLLLEDLQLKKSIEKILDQVNRFRK